jgi:septal ring factor EnvC (AmiA/AmiB activator)
MVDGILTRSGRVSAGWTGAIGEVSGMRQRRAATARRARWARRLGIALIAVQALGPAALAQTGAKPSDRLPLRDSVAPTDPTPGDPKSNTSPPPAASPASEAQARRQAVETELERITRDSALGKEREAQIRLEIEALEKDRTRLNEQVLAAAARLKALDSDLGARETRIKAIADDEAKVRASLAKRRAVLADVLAALQRIGRKPPPAVVVRPEDALASVRSAILIGAVLPELRHEAEALVADLENYTKIREKAVAERDKFRADATSLAEERARLETLMEERRKARGEQEQKLADERRRAEELAAKAGSLKELIGKLETDIDSSRKAAEAARKADADRLAKGDGKPDQKTVTASLGDAARLQPAVPFPDAKGLLPLPVGGAILKNFGDDDGTGGTVRGISIAARPESRVTSPCDGWIVFAGPFRSYGKVLIINGGGGYHIVLAGMDRIDVENGQFVLAGEPVGVMGQRHAAGAAVSTSGSPDGDRTTQPGATQQGSTQPVLYVEFRKDNTSIDPAPWWARSRDEKVRG